jgi:hypothetical protein
VHYTFGMSDSGQRDGQGPTNKYAGPVVRAGDAASPYPVSRLAPAFDLVDAARAIQEASGALALFADGRLRGLAEQVRALEAEARRVLEETHRSLELHRAECRFAKRPGHVYHAYERPDGARYLSMLSPGEWGGRPPHAHLGSYRLEADQSFTPLEQVAERDRETSELRALFRGVPTPRT